MCEKLLFALKETKEKLKRLAQMLLASVISDLETSLRDWRLFLMEKIFFHFAFNQFHKEFDCVLCSAMTARQMVIQSNSYSIVANHQAQLEDE